MLLQSTQLNDLFAEFKNAGITFDKMDSQDWEHVYSICNEHEQVIWIHDFVKLSPHFINTPGKEFYGFETNLIVAKGFQLFAQITHPEDFAAIHRSISYFNTNPSGTSNIAYRGKHNSGVYRWFYSTDRALIINSVGNTEYLIALANDIENLLHSGARNNKSTSDYNQKLILYSSLTKREKQILNLIAHGFTSREIGGKLFIEPSTVDTHRKHIKKKLHAKATTDLVEYSLLFENENS